MAVKPQPMQYTCRQCGWATVYAPSSDALLVVPPNCCKKCGCKDLEISQPGIGGKLRAISRTIFRLPFSS